MPSFGTNLPAVQAHCKAIVFNNHQSLLTSPARVDSPPAKRTFFSLCHALNKLKQRKEERTPCNLVVAAW